MKAWGQAIGLTVLAGIVFIAVPLAATIAGPLLGVIFVMLIVASLLKMNQKN